MLCIRTMTVCSVAEQGAVEDCDAALAYDKAAGVALRCRGATKLMLGDLEVSQRATSAAVQRRSNLTDKSCDTAVYLGQKQASFMDMNTGSPRLDVTC